MTLPADEVDWPKTIAGAVYRRVVAEQGARKAHGERARAAAHELAARLAAEPGVRRVLLFGSLAGPGGAVHERSDIDLAVEGLPAALEAPLARALQEMTDIHVDLVRLEDASEGLRARIEDDGEVLHVAP